MTLSQLQGYVMWHIARQLLSTHVNAHVLMSLNSRGSVFSVRGLCREDIREYRNGNSRHLSSEAPREEQCGQKKN
jgi:hypothetical protein